MNPPKIAGIDPSLTRTGIAVSSAEPLPIVSAIKSKPQGQDLPERFARYSWLADKTMQAIEGANIVFIEGYSYGSRGRAVVTLGEYGGVLRSRLLDEEMEVYEIAPTMLKQFVTGKGNAGKPAFISRLVKRWGVEFAGEDEYFAFGLWWFGQVFCGFMEPDNIIQRLPLLIRVGLNTNNALPQSRTQGIGT